MMLVSQRPARLLDQTCKLYGGKYVFMLDYPTFVMLYKRACHFNVDATALKRRNKNQIGSQSYFASNDSSKGQVIQNSREIVKNMCNISNARRRAPTTYSQLPYGVLVAFSLPPNNVSVAQILNAQIRRAYSGLRANVRTAIMALKNFLLQFMQHIIVNMAY